VTQEFNNPTIAMIAEEIDRRLAYGLNARCELDALRSLNQDSLTGESDLWLKTQLLSSVDDVEYNLRQSLPYEYKKRDQYAEWEIQLMREQR